jgi:signal transduction histidine kinase
MKKGVAIPLVLLACASLAWPETRLNAAERAWLAEKGEILFVGQSAYPPFEFLHPRHGEYTGMAIELIRWIATEFGFSAVFEPMSFVAAQEAVLDGRADAITGLFRSEERERRFTFSAEVFSVPASIFVKRERTDIVELSDLEGKRVAVQRGDYAIEFLREAGIQVDFRYTDNFSSALNAVAQGEADALIGDEQIVLYYIYDGRLTGAVKKTGEALYIGSDCMAAALGSDMLIGILDKGLAKARDSGTLATIYEKWLGVSFAAHNGNSSAWVLPLSLALGAALLLAAAVSFWTLQLRRLVRLKTDELTKLNAALKTSNQNLTAANAQLVRDMEERSRFEEERRRLETRMIKAQSYESMALMAGGIAHDFNNLLTAIVGGVNVALLSLEERSEAASYLNRSLEIAKQAGELARRMLEFSGLNIFANERLNLGELVQEAALVLRSMSPHGARIEFRVPDEALFVQGDAVQLRQVLANLVANAVEASPNDQALLTVAVRREYLNTEAAKRIKYGSSLDGGSYALLEVRDRGIGIAPENRDRIFDPFYTTKKNGRGLGLAALLGIVKAHKGAIDVESEAQAGTAIRVYLPLLDGSPSN